MTDQGRLGDGARLAKDGGCPATCRVAVRRADWPNGATAAWCSCRRLPAADARSRLLQRPCRGHQRECCEEEPCRQRRRPERHLGRALASDDRSRPTTTGVRRPLASDDRSRDGSVRRHEHCHGNHWLAGGPGLLVRRPDTARRLHSWRHVSTPLRETGAVLPLLACCRWGGRLQAGQGVAPHHRVHEEFPPLFSEHTLISGHPHFVLVKVIARAQRSMCIGCVIVLHHAIDIWC